MTELPLVILNVQRAGPSTGMPTKSEQADLLMAMYGRHGESPAVVLAAATAGDCFYMAMEAVRLATKYMTPVLLLSDSFLANTAEPFRIPDPSSFPDMSLPPLPAQKILLPIDAIRKRWLVPGSRPVLPGWSTGLADWRKRQRQAMSVTTRPIIARWSVNVPARLPVSPMISQKRK